MLSFYSRSSLTFLPLIFKRWSSFLLKMEEKATHAVGLLFWILSRVFTTVPVRSLGVESCRLLVPACTMITSNSRTMALTRRQILLLLILRRKFRKKNLKFVQGRLWVCKIYEERKDKGEFHLLVREMKLFDHQYFYQQFQMSTAKFEELLNIFAPRIAKCSLQREPIGPSERLCCTLHYLVTGDAQSSIAASCRISKTSVCRIVKETTDALWDVVKENEVEFWEFPKQAF